MNDDSFLWAASLTEPLMKITVDSNKMSILIEDIFDKTGLSRLTVTAAKFDPEIPFSIRYSGATILEKKLYRFNHQSKILTKLVFFFKVAFLSLDTRLLPNSFFLSPPVTG